MGKRTFRIIPMVACLIFLLPASITYSKDVLTANQAINFVGSSETVCGRVVTPNYLSGRRKAPTFLNLDQPYPSQIFTALIWGSDRGKFSYKPEVTLAGINY